MPSPTLDKDQVHIADYLATLRGSLNILLGQTTGAAYYSLRNVCQDLDRRLRYERELQSRAKQPDRANQP